jgi:hypothetical protein
MIRELKLYDLCGEVSPNVIEINELFNDLFSNLSIYTQNRKPDLIFMKDGKYIMEQDLKNSVLWCRYPDFWEVLEKKYTLKNIEIQEVISYKVATMFEKTFKNGYLTTAVRFNTLIIPIEDAFKHESLTPANTNIPPSLLVEEDFKTEYLIAFDSFSYNCIRVEEAFKNGFLTQI